MMTELESTEAASRGWGVADRSLILTEAEAILADPSFCKSRRCVVLLKRLIEHAVYCGEGEALKERTLGIEVFGRKPDYDTNADPIVRMTANEIRKRLAQYYQFTERNHRVHIRLTPGSYVPEVKLSPEPVLPSRSPSLTGYTGPEPVPLAAAEASPRHEHHEPSDVVENGAAVNTFDEAPHAASGGGRAFRLYVWVLAAGLVVLLLPAAWTAFGNTRSNQYRLWVPLLETKEPVSICVADLSSSGLPADWASTLAFALADRKLHVASIGEAEPLTPFVDTQVAGKIQGWLEAHKQRSNIARSSTVTFDDLRRGNVVMLGIFDNPWTLFLMKDLRFHVQIDPTTKAEWIEDRQNPGKREWEVSGDLPYPESSTDYAVVSRIFDQDTGHWILAAGGLGMHATQAAGDLLTDPELARTLPDSVRAAKNLQLIVKTKVIAGHTGAPQVLAVHTW